MRVCMWGLKVFIRSGVDDFVVVLGFFCVDRVIIYGVI